MALSGTLQDMGPIDLVQYPHAGRKTGELIVAGPNGEGRLYYKKGKPVHAAAGELQGMEALVEILDWSRGEFEFRLGIEAKKSTLDLDLHQTLMQALKLRDERQQESTPASSKEAELNAALDSFLATTPSVLQAIVVAPDGSPIAEASREGDTADAEQLLRSLSELLASYPRTGLRRVLLEDAAGIVVLATLPSSRGLVLVSDDRAPLGAVAMQVGKLAASLKGREP
jgi:predicted regulator of Ras-like GTPase activity (Roadblock/LC7/MglB family)